MTGFTLGIKPRGTHPAPPVDVDNIFEPTGTEQPIDVSGDGKLSNTATKLHNQLQSILQDWNEEQIKQHQ